MTWLARWAAAPKSPRAALATDPNARVRRLARPPRAKAPSADSADVAVTSDHRLSWMRRARSRSAARAGGSQTGGLRDDLDGSFLWTSHARAGWLSRVRMASSTWRARSSVSGTSMAASNSGLTETQPVASPRHPRTLLPLRGLHRRRRVLGAPADRARPHVHFHYPRAEHRGARQPHSAQRGPHPCQLPKVTTGADS
jgi:hypothetical protein